MSEPLDYKGYPMKPRNIDDTCWYYEEPKGLLIVTGSRQYVIPWRRVIAAVNHHFNAKRKKRS